MKTESKLITLAFILIAGIIIFYFAFLSGDKDISGNIETGANPPRGSLESNIKIIEFSDFECPFCRQGAEMMDGLLKEYSITFYYRNFPLSIHPNSHNAAMAAECSGEQEKFWEYHDILFKNQENLGKNSLKAYAKQIGLDEEKFNSCLDSEKYASDIEKDLKEGIAAGVQGTPTFFVNGKKVVGANKQEIEAIINSIKD